MLVSNENQREYPFGSQRLYKFENGYGASVVCNQMSYGGSAGLYELAVIKWDGEDWTLNYDSGITEDVLGWLSEYEVTALLDRIEAL